MKIKPHYQDHTSNGGMATNEASTTRMSLMLCNDSDERQLDIKTFYSWRDEQREKSNVELTKQFPMTM